MSTNLPQTDSMIGVTVDQGRYEIVKLIGEGGMGKVFQARQLSMNRMVALKILRANMAADEHLLARFQQEALSVSRLRHPNTITIFDYGRTEAGQLFMAMELLGGRSLFTLIREDERMALGRALHLFEQVVGAVAEAHKLGIVHRDLKPENIQIDEVAGDPDFAKVLDFGIAKIMHGGGEGEERLKALTMAGAIFGTPHYMSPEQVHGLKIDHRTDIYSLGIILFELLTGEPPFDGSTPMAVMMAQASKTPPDIREICPEADVNDAVLVLIDDCLRKERDERISTCDELLDRVRQIQYGLGEVSSINAYSFHTGRTGTGSAVRPAERRSTPAPPGRNSRSDGQHTPEMSGHVSTIPPDLFTPDETVNYGASNTPKIIIGLMVLVGLGVGGFMAFGPSKTEPEATSGDAVRIEINAERIEYTISSKPTGADIFEGETALGKTPLKRFFVKGAKTRLRLWKPGYEDAFVEVSGEGAEEQALSATLEKIEVEKPKHVPVAPAAWLKITSKPKGVKVFRDDDEIGVTPFTWRPDVTATPVTLRFEKAGYKATAEQLMLTAAGEHAVGVSARLKRTRRTKRPPRHRKPLTHKTPGTKKTPATNTPPKTKTTPDTSPYEKL